MAPRRACRFLFVLLSAASTLSAFLQPSSVSRRETTSRARARPRLAAVQRKPRPVPPPASEDALAIRVCMDPKKSCGPRGGEEVLALMKEVAGGACEVTGTACVGPCSLGVNVVAGWVDSRKKFQRAGVERDADDPAGQVSKSSLRKNKPGVYNKVSTKADCEVVLSLLQDKANAALGLTADGGDP